MTIQFLHSLITAENEKAVLEAVPPGTPPGGNKKQLPKQVDISARKAIEEGIFLCLAEYRKAY